MCLCVWAYSLRWAQVILINENGLPFILGFFDISSLVTFLPPPTLFDLLCGGCLSSRRVIYLLIYFYEGWRAGM